MKRLLIYILISLCCKLTLIAQVNYAQIDKITYDFYMDQQWDSVLYYGDIALNNDIDYFYLRMRMGISYYEKKNYIKASEHFNEAIEFDSLNKITWEYLYYSYLFAGRDSDASMTVKHLPEKLISERNIKNRNWIESINTEAGISQADLPFTMNNEDLDGEANIYADGSLLNSTSYYHVGLKHRPLQNLEIYHGPSLININKSHIVYYKNQRYERPVDIEQKAYYVQLKYTPAISWELSTAFHMLKYSVDRMRVDSIDYQLDAPVFSIFKRESDVEYLIYGSIGKQIGIFKPTLSYLRANFNLSTQHQLGLDFLYFPKGNQDLYGKTELTYFIQDSLFEMRSLIFTQTAGAKVFKNLWAQVEYSIGDRRNYAHSSGFVVDNKNLIVNSSLRAKVLWQITPKLGFSVIMSESQYESMFLRYTSQKEDGYELIDYNFKLRSLVGSLELKF